MIAPAAPTAKRRTFAFERLYDLGARLYGRAATRDALG